MRIVSDAGQIRDKGRSLVWDLTVKFISFSESFTFTASQISQNFYRCRSVLNKWAMRPLVKTIVSFHMNKLEASYLAPVTSFGQSRTPKLEKYFD